MSSQPLMGGHLVIPQNDISDTNKPPMSSHLRVKATFPVSRGWLLIAGSIVCNQNIFNVTLHNYIEIICKNTPHRFFTSMW